ncbi:N-terminal domain of galactosyltransferase [Fragilaria crotonensis]|nr:N-terminal domain of galactosyltransferase [Fragilaria crotonensis]
MKNGHAMLGMLATAIVAFQVGYILSAWSDLSSVPSVGLTSQAHLLGHGPPLPDALHDGIASTATTNHHVVQADIPVYWIESSQDDFYERVYGDPETLTHLRRNLTVKHYFPHVCGLYRFDTDRLPTVSVIVTLRNEQPNMVSLTVHSILGRTPPSLLQEVIIIDDSDEKVTDELAKLMEVSKRLL